MGNFTVLEKAVGEKTEKMHSETDTKITESNDKLEIYLNNVQTEFDTQTRD